MKHKYNVRSSKEARTLDGMVFDSMAELNRYAELKALQAAGRISKLERQPVYLIVDKSERNKRHIYTPDFRYYENGIEIVEEVKGVKTQDYILRRDLFLSRYNLHFREVTKDGIKDYKAVG